MIKIQNELFLFFINKNKIMEFYSKENELDNHEYKWKLVDIDSIRLSMLIFQLFRRLTQGNGTAIYSIGVRDNGIIDPITDVEFKESLDNLHIMARNLKAEITEINIIKKDGLSYGDFSFTSNCQIGYQDIRVIVLGNVNSGKSTMMGVLISGKLDELGDARNHVATHVHEISSGKTSDMSYRLLGFSNDGTYLNHTQHRYRAGDIAKKSSKIVTLVDLPGHREYIRTALRGVVSIHSDLAMVIVDASGTLEDSHTTKCHLEALDAYNIPFFIVMTKVDVSTDESCLNVSKNLARMIRQINSSYKLLAIRKMEDLNNIKHPFIPVFQLSNRTGKGLEVLIHFFRTMLPRSRKSTFINLENSSIMPVINIYPTTLSGLVISGIIHCGNFQKNQQVYIGPDGLGNFEKCKIKQIQCNYQVIDRAMQEDHIAVSFSGLSKSFVMKKGMVVIDEYCPRIAKNEWKIKIRVTGQKFRISVGSCPFGYIGNRELNFRITKIFEDVETQEGINKFLILDEEYTLMVSTSRYVFAGPKTPIIFFEGSLVAKGHVIE